jgi:DNA helicase-2/ATP-dependent DNA helicase PcrA
MSAQPVNQNVFTPSPYQAAIFNFIQHGTGNAIVDAVAGSGKSTTLVQAAKLLPTRNALFCAFNKHIEQELKAKLGSLMQTKTIHAIGYGALAREIKINGAPQGDKYKKLCKPDASRLGSQARIAAGIGNPAPRDNDYLDALVSLINYIQTGLVDPNNLEALQAMVEHYSIDLPCDLSVLQPLVVSILKEGIRIASEQGIISFSDLLYLPYVWNLRLRKYDFVFVDEAQDLSRAQLWLVMESLATNGRMCAVGDPRQAIYAFAGADADSYNNIKKLTNATEFPLSVCYRCPKEVIARAQQIVPQIQATETAPAGLVADIADSLFNQMVKEGDLVLCRLTAPLVSKCLALIAQKKSARVKGKDIGKMLSATVKQVSEMLTFKFAEFPKFLDYYCQQQIEKLGKRENSESAIESMIDRCESLQVCFTSFDALDIQDFCNQIEALFSDDQKGITLSTVHRAKGLEENRVFILKPDKLPLTWANQEEWQYEQEMNLLYVAITRAKQALYFVQDGSVQQPLPLEGMPQAPAESLTEQAVSKDGHFKGNADLNVIACQIEELITEAAAIINQHGVIFPKNTTTCLVDLRTGVEKLLAIAASNAQENQ